MTIQALQSARKMAKYNSDGSDSELEEGEIANDEIEIIEEVIRRPPSASLISVKSLTQNSSRPPPPNFKRSPPPNKKSDALVEPILKRPRIVLEKETANAGATSTTGRVGHKGEGKFASRSSNPKRRSSSSAIRRKSPPRNQLRKVQLGSYKSHSSDNSHLSKDSSKSGGSQKILPNEQTLISKPIKPERPEPAQDAKWIPAFESTSRCSVESMDIDPSSEDEDEVLGLRLAALHSVVSNGSKSKEVKEPSVDAVDAKSPKSPPPESAASDCPTVEETQVMFPFSLGDFPFFGAVGRCGVLFFFSLFFFSLVTHLFLGRG